MAWAPCCRAYGTRSWSSRRLRFCACLLVGYGLFLVPGFVEVLASHRPVTLMPGAHYSALLTGYAPQAFVDGASRLVARWPRAAQGSVPAAAAAGIAIGIFASPMEYWYYLYLVRPTRTTRCLQILSGVFRRRRRLERRTKSSCISASIRTHRSALPASNGSRTTKLTTGALARG